MTRSRPEPEMSPAEREAVIRFLEELADVADSTGKHEGRTLRQVGRCVYCSCGFRYQGSLP